MKTIAKICIKTIIYLFVFSTLILNLTPSWGENTEEGLSISSLSYLYGQINPTCEQVPYTAIHTSTSPALKRSIGTEWCCNTAVLIWKCDWGGTLTQCEEERCAELWTIQK